MQLIDGSIFGLEPSDIPTLHVTCDTSSLVFRVFRDSGKPLVFTAAILSDVGEAITALTALAEKCFRVGMSSAKAKANWDEFLERSRELTSQMCPVRLIEWLIKTAKACVVTHSLVPSLPWQFFFYNDVFLGEQLVFIRQLFDTDVDTSVARQNIERSNTITSIVGRNLNLNHSLPGISGYNGNDVRVEWERHRVICDWGRVVVITAHNRTTDAKLATGPREDEDLSMSCLKELELQIATLVLLNCCNGSKGGGYSICHGFAERLHQQGASVVVAPAIPISEGLAKYTTDELFSRLDKSRCPLKAFEQVARDAGGKFRPRIAYTFYSRTKVFHSF